MRKDLGICLDEARAQRRRAAGDRAGRPVLRRGPEDGRRPLGHLEPDRPARRIDASPGGPSRRALILASRPRARRRAGLTVRQHAFRRSTRLRARRSCGRFRRGSSRRCGRFDLLLRGRGAGRWSGRTGRLRDDGRRRALHSRCRRRLRRCGSRRVRRRRARDTLDRGGAAFRRRLGSRRQRAGRCGARRCLKAGLGGPRRTGRTSLGFLADAGASRREMPRRLGPPANRARVRPPPERVAPRTVGGLLGPAGRRGCRARRGAGGGRRPAQARLRIPESGPKHPADQRLASSRACRRHPGPA